jgi:hypothetical protein
MNRPLEEHRPAALVDRIAVEIVFHDVVERDELRATRARQEKAVGPVGMAHTDVTE